MKNRLLSCVAVLALIGMAGMPAVAQDAAASPERLREDMRAMVTKARDRVYPALVNISVITVSYWGGKETKGGSTGSGTILSEEGYVLTNQHVVNDGKKFRVTLADKRELPATLVGEDPLTDLAVIKIDLSKLNPGEKLPVASFGESGKLVVGDTVMAMGSPLALSRSVTLGIVSNTERVFTAGMGDDVEEMAFERGRTGLFTSWIQHDAAINPGNSGGPLVDLEGRVVGVNAMMMGPSGIGLAIPQSLAQPVYNSLIKHGEVIRSAIGVAFKAIKRSDYKEGVIVNSVLKGSAADKAGLKAGDLVVSMNGEPLTVRFPEEVPLFSRKIAELPVGSTIKFGYQRGTNRSETSITTEKLLKETGDESALRLWGLSLREITEKLARDLQLPDMEGALVLGTRSGSPADTSEPQMGGGDIIKSIDGAAIKTMKDVIVAYKSIMAKDPIPEYVLIGFDRQGKSFLTIIKPRPDKKEDPPREVAKSWIGIATQPVLKELAAKLGDGKNTGFRVTRIYPGTEAAKSELKVGDIIVAVNGERISPRTMQEAGALNRKVRNLPMSTPAKLGVVRDGAAVEVSVATERTRITREEALKDTNKDFEVTVRELTFFDRDEARWTDDVSGVVTENVEQAGWAGLAGMGPGDLIQRINETDITDIVTYRKAMDTIAKDQPAKVTFLVLRGSRTFILFAEPEWKATAKSEKEESK
ncbi:MAG: trypsin-like peptidase domain-containing protein [Planctomycetota bacterium]|nr:trypsin-like peptidase domain-containing protein [Planctomycetota bacterium]